MIEQGDLELTSDTIERFAAALAGLGANERAAQLAGAADQLREVSGIPRSEPDQVLLERALGPARAVTGNAVWGREYAAGRGLTVDQAKELGCLPVP